LRGVAAICPPVSLEACARALRRTENFIYEWRFILSLRRTVRARARLFPGVYDTSPLPRIRHLWDWDEAYQHHNGFAGAQDYYDRASSLPFIAQIRIPTAIITAQDDPFIPFASFRDQRIADNPNVLLVPTTHGGHVAFCGSPQPDEDRGWAEARAVEFCQTVMSE
jgi:predicted alpha/beta-fold hydrolase